MTRARDLAAFVSNADGDIKFDTDTLFIDSSANRVGIGTTTPASALHLEGDTPVVTLRDDSAYSAGTGPYVQFQGLDSGGTNRNFGQIYGLSNGSNSGELAFHTRNSGTSAERLRIDSGGSVIIGHTEEIPIVNASVELSVIGTGSTLGVARFGGAPTIALAASASGTVGSFSALSNGDAMGYIFFGGDDGTDIRSAGASIKAEVDGTPGSNDMPGRLVFSTTSDGSASPTERMRILSGGGLTFNGDTAAANALSDYEEGTWAPTSNGATGVSNPSTVRGALYTKVGNLVTVNAEFVLPTNSNSSQCTIGGLPYPTSNTSVYRDMGNAAANVSFGLISYVVNNASNFGLYNDENYGAVSYATLSGKTIVVNITYKTDS